MKCMVCDTEFQHSEDGCCPNCGFYSEYEILGEDIRRSKEQIRSMAAAHRALCLQSLRLGVLLHEWEAQGEEIREKQITERLFATGEALEQGPVWLEEPLARIPEAEKLTVEVVLRNGGSHRVAALQLPNLHQPLLQQVGFQFDGRGCARVLLKNPEASTQSEPFRVLFR